MASRNSAFHERGVAGVLLLPLKWFCVTLLLLLGLILAAWIIDWFFVFKVWPAGVAKLQHILDQDLQRASQVECWCKSVPGFAARMSNILYSALFKMTGLHAMALRFADAAPLSVLDTIVRTTYMANYDAVRVAMVGTQLFGVRLASLAMAVPLVLLVYCVASTDGLTQRFIRRASGGRESASLYHRGKHLQIVVLATTAAANVLAPYSVDARYLWIPAGAALAILARLQWAYYKKHL